MRGAEYLSAPALQDIRSSLDNWVCMQIRATNTLDALLARRAPRWHQLGRVYFHLAEYKNDPDFPFAFMATYAPSVGYHLKLTPVLGGNQHLPGFCDLGTRYHTQ